MRDHWYGSDHVVRAAIDRAEACGVERQEPDAAGPVVGPHVGADVRLDEPPDPRARREARHPDVEPEGDQPDPRRRRRTSRRCSPAGRSGAARPRAGTASAGSSGSSSGGSCQVPDRVGAGRRRPEVPGPVGPALLLAVRPGPSWGSSRLHHQRATDLSVCSNRPLRNGGGTRMARSGVGSRGSGDDGRAHAARIVEAAIETLKTEGFAGASARAIARTGGFNQALVFYHFGSVNELLHRGARRDERDAHGALPGRGRAGGEPRRPLPWSRPRSTPRTSTRATSRCSPS